MYFCKTFVFIFLGKSKRYSKVNPTTYHENAEREKGELRYTSTLSFTVVVDGGLWLMPGWRRFIFGNGLVPAV